MPNQQTNETIERFNPKFKKYSRKLKKLLLELILQQKVKNLNPRTIALQIESQLPTKVKANKSKAKNRLSQNLNKDRNQCLNQA